MKYMTFLWIPYPMCFPHCPHNTSHVVPIWIPYGDPVAKGSGPHMGNPYGPHENWTCKIHMGPMCPCWLGSVRFWTSELLLSIIPSWDMQLEKTFCKPLVANDSPSGTPYCRISRNVNKRTCSPKLTVKRRQMNQGKTSTNGLHFNFFKNVNSISHLLRQ